MTAPTPNAHARNKHILDVELRKADDEHKAYRLHGRKKKIQHKRKSPKTKLGKSRSMFTRSDGNEEHGTVALALDDQTKHARRRVG